MKCTWSTHWLDQNTKSLLPTAPRIIDLPLKLDDGRLSLSLEILRKRVHNTLSYCTYIWLCGWYKKNLSIYIFILVFGLNIGVKKKKKKKKLIIIIITQLNIWWKFKVKTTSFLKSISRPCVWQPRIWHEPPPSLPRNNTTQLGGIPKLDQSPTWPPL